jgi:hypothetical protein
MDLPLWAWIICALSALVILGITFFPGQRTTLRGRDQFVEIDSDERPTWEICREHCRDRTCQVFGCPSHPDWRGDMR